MVWSRVDNVLLVASIPPPPLLPYASSSSYPNGNVEGADDDEEEEEEDEEDGSFFLGAVLHPKTSLDVVAAADAKVIAAADAREYSRRIGLLRFSSSKGLLHTPTNAWKQIGCVV